MSVVAMTLLEGVNKSRIKAALDQRPMHLQHDVFPLLPMTRKEPRWRENDRCCSSPVQAPQTPCDEDLQTEPFIRSKTFYRLPCIAREHNHFNQRIEVFVRSIAVITQGSRHKTSSLVNINREVPLCCCFTVDRRAGTLFHFRCGQVREYYDSM